jgi:hypothetical protein
VKKTSKMKFQLHNQSLRKQKTTFSKEEDLILFYVKENGSNNFPQMIQLLPHRSVRQIKERYRLYLDPSVNQNPFTPEEDHLLLQLSVHLNRKWSQIAKFFPGRTDVALKYRWKKYSRKGFFLKEKSNSKTKKNSQKNKFLNDKQYKNEFLFSVQFENSHQNQTIETNLNFQFEYIFFDYDSIIS